MNEKSYSELIALPSFEERFHYLRSNCKVGESTFGFDRYLNQRLYTSKEWKDIRNYVIVRDNGCDLACLDREIHSKIIIHHINPISEKDIVNRSKIVLDPDNLICVSHITHNAIHYGDEKLLILDVVERHPFDTCPWRK